MKERFGAGQSVNQWVWISYFLNWTENEDAQEGDKKCREEKVEKKTNRNKEKGSGEGRNMDNLASNWVVISKDQVTKPSYRTSFEGGFVHSFNK